jgi:anti-sigma regulatory factor (Ser/Thr protein kinase)
LPGRAAQVREARTFIAKTLADHGLCHEVACMLASELVTNSLKHSDSGLPGGAVTIAVTIERDTAAGGAALIEVTDNGGRAEPVLRDADPFAVCGRGLQLVDAMSDDWGYYRHDGQQDAPDSGKLVTWFRVCPPPGDTHAISRQSQQTAERPQRGRVA